MHSALSDSDGETCRRLYRKSWAILMEKHAEGYTESLGAIPMEKHVEGYTESLGRF